MRRVWRHIVTSLCVISSVGYSQDRFEAIPESIKAEYRIDFARLFFTSRDQQRLDQKRLQSMLKGMESFKGRLAHSPENLLQALELNDSIQVKEALHDAFLYLRYAVNTKDATSKDDDDALIAEVNSRTQVLDEELRQISDDTLSYFLHTFLNIDLEDPDILSDVLKVLDSKLNALKMLYLQVEKKAPR